TCALPISAFADVVLARIDVTGRGPIPEQNDDSGQERRKRDGGRSHLAALLQMSQPMTKADIRSHVVSALHRVLPAGRSLCFGVGSTVDRLDQVYRSWFEAGYVVDALKASWADSLSSGRRGESTHVEGSSGSRSDSNIVGATTEDVAAELIGLEVADVLRDADPKISAPA